MSKKYTSIFANIFRALEADLDADIQLLDDLSSNRKQLVKEALEAVNDQARYDKINADIDVLNAGFQSGPGIPKL